MALRDVVRLGDGAVHRPCRPRAVEQRATVAKVQATMDAAQSLRRMGVWLPS